MPVIHKVDSQLSIPVSVRSVIVSLNWYGYLVVPLAKIALIPNCYFCDLLIWDEYISLFSVVFRPGRVCLFFCF